MTQETLQLALEKIGWTANISAFFEEPSGPRLLVASMKNIAVWAANFEQIDGENPAICFIREMQIASMNSAILIASGLYKPAAASMRSLLESSLYYSYFRNHKAELATLARNEGFYVDKATVIKFHKEHTFGFEKRQKDVGLIARLEKWYGSTSAVIHGQLPGSWVTYTSVENVSYDSAVAKKALDAFVECEYIVRIFFLTTLAQEFWYCFDSDSKKMLLKSLPGNLKTALSLDVA